MSNPEARKHRRDSDDLKVLFIGVCIYIMMTLTGPIILDQWDRYFAHRPFIVASVEVIPPSAENSDTHVGHENAPRIIYRTFTHQQIDATWIASIFSVNGDRLAARRGHGSYPKQPPDNHIWTWDAFFENEYATGAPDVPKQPFRVCVRYIAEARDSGVQDETPIYCSSIYDPFDPYPADILFEPRED